jgi:hypothetical protein
MSLQVITSSLAYQKTEFKLDALGSICKKKCHLSLAWHSCMHQKDDSFLSYFNTSSTNKRIVDSQLVKMRGRDPTAINRLFSFTTLNDEF